MLLHRLGGVFLECGGHGVGVLGLKENQIPVLPLGLERGEVNAVLSGDPGKGADILVCDLNTLQAPVLGSKLLDGHFSMGLLLLVGGFHMGQEFCHSLAKLLFRQLGAVDDQGEKSE